MEKGFGIAALIIAVIAIFIPMPVWLCVSWVALLLVTVAALAGDRVFSISVIVLTIVNTVVFSPVTLALLLGANEFSWLLAFHIVAIITPIAAVILKASGILATDGAFFKHILASTNHLLATTHDKTDNILSSGRYTAAARSAADTGEETWQAIKDRNDANLFEEFMEQFPQHPRTMMARLRLNGLRKKTGSVPEKQASPPLAAVWQAEPEPIPVEPVQPMPEPEPTQESPCEATPARNQEVVIAASPQRGPPPEFPQERDSSNELIRIFTVFGILVTLVASVWWWNQESQRQQAANDAIEQQKKTRDQSNRAREAAEAETRRQREAAAEVRWWQGSEARVVPERSIPEPEPQRQVEEVSNTVGFTIINNTSSTANVAFFDHESRQQIDPPADRFYLLNGGGTQTYRINCAVGQSICYGAVMTGGNLMPFWGNGRNGQQPCAECCLSCPAPNALVKTLNYSDSRKPSPTITWKITDNTTKPISLALYSQTRFQWGWPEWNRNWTLRGGENTFTVNCVEGEKICFGAWIVNNIAGPYWGVGPYSRFGCANCCGVCDGGTYTAGMSD